MHTGDGFLLVYSITDDQTFEELQGIREQILRVHPNGKVPMIVIGNKLDLASKDRAVTVDEGNAFAKKFDSSLIEVSVSRAIYKYIYICIFIYYFGNTCLENDDYILFIYLCIYCYYRLRKTSR